LWYGGQSFSLSVAALALKGAVALSVCMRGRYYDCYYGGDVAVFLVFGLWYVSYSVGNAAEKGFWHVCGFLRPCVNTLC
jgi:hypothetical protein